VRPRFLGAVFRRLPPVASRDQRIRDLRRRIARLREEKQALQAESERPVTRASYFAMLKAESRMRELGAPATSVIRHGKFYVYDVAQSHGIAIPEQLGRWSDPWDIPWDQLPDLVVVKSKRGSTSRGVLPLRRIDGGWEILTHDGTVHTGEDLSARLASRVEKGTISGPFGAEEFLDEDGTGSRPPMDVKVYAFYGEAVMAALRRSDHHGNTSATRWRVVDRQGREVTTHFGGHDIDPGIETPERLEELFDVAERMTVAIRASFSRIDLYSVGDKVVFGEVTPRPGVDQRYPMEPELDQRLGDAWERAKVRIARDTAAGGSTEVPKGPISTVDGVSAEDRAPVDAVNHPSFQARLNAERRHYALSKELRRAKPPTVIAGGKFKVYDLVRSHGIEVPRQYGQWRHPANIPWEDLPDRVVIKSAFATSARGVFPLRRTPDGWEIITQDVTVTTNELVADLSRLREARKISQPFGAEEFLVGEDTGELPIDVRTYAFYGHVPFALLRRPEQHGDLEAARFRPVDAHGTDLIDPEKYPALATTDRAQLPRELAVLDLTIPVPKNIEDVIDAAARLSTAIRLPFCRIDMYGIGDRVVFGELTPRPGGRQWLGPELDVMLGDAWERAQARLTRDLADGASPEPEWGPFGDEPEPAR
jgi:hypothetical protein